MAADGPGDPFVQWLVSDGKLGRCPDYAEPILTARWAGLAPWTLLGIEDTRSCLAWGAWVSRVRRATERAAHERAVRAERRARRGH